MLKIVCIRHGKTYGNTLGRYIGGRTDEPLCKEGIALLEKGIYPKTDHIYVSPMKRCRQTAEILYPGEKQTVIESLKECDFGDFENKNYKELEKNPEYQAWIDSNGSKPFPGGESHEQFEKRCCEGFLECIEDAMLNGEKQITIIVHGGTIMSILSAFAEPKGQYFKWQIKNGEFYELILQEKLWNVEKTLSSVRKGVLRND